MAGLRPSLRAGEPQHPGSGRAVRPAHRRASEPLAWIVFSGQADHAWLRLLRPGFRHCFAALRDATGWTVLDPLTGRLLVARLDVPAAFDLPGFYARAGLRVLGPFEPGPPACRAWRLGGPFTCVTLCRAVLGAAAPQAWTPHGLYRALQARVDDRKKNLTTAHPGR